MSKKTLRTSPKPAFIFFTDGGVHPKVAYVRAVLCSVLISDDFHTAVSTLHNSPNQNTNPSEKVTPARDGRSLKEVGENLFHDLVAALWLYKLYL